WTHVQRRHLRVVAIGRTQAGDRIFDRSADSDDDARRVVRLADGPRLYDRLHGGRSRVYAIFRLYLALHVLDADARDEQQFPAALLRLGSGRAGVVSADRLLVHP